MTFPFPQFQPPSAAFSPSSIAGLIAWFDASNSGSLTLSGSNVSQWNDLSGSGRYGSATGTQRPTLQTAAQNGLNTIGFAAAGLQYLDFSSSLTIPTDQTVFFVVSKVSTTDMIVTVSSPLTYPLVWYSNEIVYAANPAYSSSSNSGYNLSGYQLFSATITGTNVFNVYLNTTAISMAAPFAYARDSAYTYLGRYSTVYSNGSIAECVLYNSILSTPDRQSCENYLKTKWGTP